MKDSGIHSDGKQPARIRFIHEDTEPCLFDQIFSLWQDSRLACIATAFLSVRMLNILVAHLRNLDRIIPVRFLTGAMHEFNDPRVLENLRKHFGLENVHLYQPQTENISDASNFHIKAYLFQFERDNWTVVIGSSNLTEAALLGRRNEASRRNAEWNLLIESGAGEDHAFVADILARFNYYWNAHSVILDDAQLESYRQKWLAQQEHKEESSASDRLATLLKPEARPVQKEALQRLQEFRRLGLKRGAIIGATGIGKTLISAFDVQASQSQKILFVAHRETLLHQAAEAYSQLFGNSLTIYRIGGQWGTQTVDGLTKGEPGPNGPLIVFAMIQTLSDPAVFSRFSPAYFDYIVVDEFHHASAPSYACLLAHFTPGFLLGLTATPERMDGRDVLELCDYNVALEIRLFDAIEQGNLAPFLYFALFDPTDYENIRWTGLGYDEMELERALSTDTRAALIANTLSDHLPAFGKTKGIAFCCNVGHAVYMAKTLTDRGFESACILGNTPESDRQDLLDRLAEEHNPLKIICAVDVLSEGIDVPALTHILLLRPTQSFTVFLQQLGRGLRPHPRKNFLVILDFVGNYRNNYVAPLVLTGQAFAEEIHFKKAELQFKPPHECYIHPDTQVKRIWNETIRTKFLKLSLKEQLKVLYEEIWDDLGHERSPLIMDFVGHPLCSDPMKFITPGAFGNWLRAKEYCGGLSEEERTWLGTPAEAFLMHVERELNSVRSYKMVVLLALLESDPGKTEWSVEEIAGFFRYYYLANPLRLQDYDDLARSPRPDTYPLGRVMAHIRNMPLKYLSDKPEKYFTLGKDIFSVKESVHPFWSRPLFRDSLRDRIHYALARYWSKKCSQSDITNAIIPSSPEDQSKTEISAPALLSFADVQDRIFRTALPFVADMAAGVFRDSFETGDLANYDELEWIEVPANLCRPKRFVVRVAGDSMSPEFEVGELLVFEYHRVPRRNGEVVLAADYSLGESSGTYAVKRCKEDNDSWVFESVNPHYKPVIIDKTETTYPILGTYVGRLS